MIPKKRSMDDVFAAIGAAMAETQGRTLDQIDHAGDAAIAIARQRVSITLQDYAPYPGAEPSEAVWRYRKELERALHGPLAVPGALQAWTLSTESHSATLTTQERALANAWVAATQRARVEGMRGLADSHTAWFEVRLLRSAPPPVPAREPASPSADPSRLRQRDLF